jgi:serine/threonine protein kinase/WD40 repeat protein
MANEPDDLFGRVLGEFVLREPIGRGGHATVYRCEQPVLNRDVVVKVLRDPRRPNDVSQERFLREARLASRLDHPYAAHVYAFGAEDDGLLWLAMELVHGASLAQWLAKHGRMPLDQFAPFFECLAQVVQEAHDGGIVHRDLKPSNVMVIERRGMLFPKLIDFGIAKLSIEAVPPSATPTDPSASIGPDEIETAQLRLTRLPAVATLSGPPDDGRLTYTGMWMGSAPYMSPEQWIDAHAVGAATDVYSLGVMIYEALTGAKPFPGPSLEGFFLQHRDAAAPALGPAFSKQLDCVVQRALSKTATDRQASVLELATELRAAHRVQPEERLRSVAQVWEEGRRRSSLLLSRDELARVPTKGIGDVASALVAESRRRLLIDRWTLRGLVAAGVALVVGGAWYAGAHKADVAQQRAEATAAKQRAEAIATQSELEQGRSALLHNEPEAAMHLMAAYRRDSTSSTAFMLARALEPRLAEQVRFKSTFGRAWSARFSPDGTQVAETDERGAQVWDAKTYQLRFVLPHDTEVYLGVYSADSQWFVTAANDAVRIWGAATGALLRKLVYPRKAGASAGYFVVAVSPDRRFIAAMDTMGSVVDVWDAATGTPVIELPTTPAGFPTVAFSADGQWLAATGEAEVRVFETQSWRLASTISTPGIRQLALDPTGPQLVTGATTGDVSTWALPSGRRLQHLRDVGSAAYAVAFSLDGQFVTAGFRDGEAIVWRASGELQRQLRARSAPIFAVEFDRSSQFVLASVTDGTAVVSDVARGMPVAVLEGPASKQFAAHFDPGSRRVVAAASDGSTRVWDARAAYLQFSSPPASTGCWVATTSEPDRRFVAVGCRDRPTRVWDTAEDRLVVELPSVSPVEGDFASAFPVVSAAGDRAAIARGNSVEVYALPQGRLHHTIVHEAAVNAVAFAPTGRDVISGAIDGSLRVSRDGGSLVVLPTAPGGIDAVAILSDGRLVAADARRQLRIYDPGGRVLATFALPGRVSSLRSEGDRLVTVPIVTNDGSPPLLVDLAGYRPVAQLGEQSVRVFSSRWVAPHQILTAGTDGAVRRWEGATGQLLQTYKAGGRVAYDADVTLEGLVIAGSSDGVVRFWDRDSGRLLWGLPAHNSLVVGLHIEGEDIVSRGFNGDLARWRLPSPARTIAACSAPERCAIVPP